MFRRCFPRPCVVISRLLSAAFCAQHARAPCPSLQALHICLTTPSVSTQHLSSPSARPARPPAVQPYRLVLRAPGALATMLCLLLPLLYARFLGRRQSLREGARRRQMRAACALLVMHTRLVLCRCVQACAPPALAPACS